MGDQEIWEINLTLLKLEMELDLCLARSSRWICMVWFCFGLDWWNLIWLRLNWDLKKLSLATANLWHYLNNVELLTFYFFHAHEPITSPPVEEVIIATCGPFCWRISIAHEAFVIAFSSWASVSIIKVVSRVKCKK